MDTSYHQQKLLFICMFANGGAPGCGDCNYGLIIMTFSIINCRNGLAGGLLVVWLGGWSWLRLEFLDNVRIGVS